MDGPTTPLLSVCSNRPHGWTDHAAKRVPLHDLASRGPSAPNRTDRRANSGPSHNIYRASVASCDKNLVYKCVVNNSRLSASCYRELMVKQATACVGLWRASTGVYCSDSISSIFKIVAFVTISKKKSTTWPQQIECLKQLRDKLYNKSPSTPQQFDNTKRVYDKSTTVNKSNEWRLSITKIASAPAENVRK